MTYCKLFTVLTAIVSSIWAGNAFAASGSRTYEMPVLEDTLDLTPQIDTTFLTPEELALLVEYIPNEPNDVIADRLSCIESDIPLVFNNFVRNFVDYFTIRNRKYTRTMISRENVYFPLFEAYLKKHNMPQDLKYLAIVESGLNPKAKSYVGAAGLWQFMPATGKEYGLKIQNEYMDERLDPEKSTEAALKFLRRLYKSYGDWELALAAYNCGPGNVNKAIRKAGGGKKTFWEIFPYLPKETRGYVPSMTAVIYAMKYAPEHHIFSDSILYATDTDVLHINQAVDLKKLALELNLEEKTLLALNPEIKQSILPAGNTYTVRIPAQQMNMFASAADKECILLASAPSVPVKQNIADLAPAKVMLASATKPATPADTTKPDEKRSIASTKRTYQVQRNDNLSEIAKRHNVTIAQLKEWNNLNGNRIDYKQQLVIYKQDSEEVPVLLASANTTPKAGEKIEQQKIRTADKTDSGELNHHIVQPGDTLWNISLRYNGIPVEKIKQLNKLKTNEIKPGQKLILS